MTPVRRIWKTGHDTARTHPGVLVMGRLGGGALPLRLIFVDGYAPAPL
jgi:hypothetical protein